MSSATIYDPEHSAKAIRAALASEMITQKELSQRTGIHLDLLNKYLRRKINLLDSDVSMILETLGIEHLNC